MLRYALTRFVSLALSLVVASLVVFVALEVVPGDPAAYMLGLNASPETVAALRGRARPRRRAGGALPRLGRAACCAATSASPTPTARRSPA